MPIPRIFISSTCFDLTDARASLGRSFENLGYEVILSDKGDVFFDPNSHTHLSCVDAVEESDVLILIIDGRFGGKAVPKAFDSIELEILPKEQEFYKNLADSNVSISQVEVLKAYEKHIPVLAFVRKNIISDHNSYQKITDKNKLPIFASIQKQETASYIFEFINYVRHREINNAYFEFETVLDIADTAKNQLLQYFQKLLSTRKIQNSGPSNYVSAKIVNHLSNERSQAFQDLFTDVDEGDEIRILGTGVTRFLSQTEVVETYLKNNNKIKILFINDQIIKTQWACSSQIFLESLNIALTNSDPRLISELEAKTKCPLSNLNFLIDRKHFNNYYNRDAYIEEVRSSYKYINDFLIKLDEKKWPGSLEAKHFDSFVPMSITAIFPDHSTNRKLLAEFIIPFTENRILLKSSTRENKEIYELFINFFQETWKRAIPLKSNDNQINSYDN